jgi:hypothetical protein
MAKNRFLLGLMAVTLVLLFLGGCKSAPIAPAVSQTVVAVTRHNTASGLGNMEIYIDGRIAQSLAKKPKDLKLKAGESISIPINNGVHSIYVQIGNNQSESINFTADGRTLAFVASYDGVIPLRKLVLSRSVIEDNTGSMTNREVQSAF